MVYINSGRSFNTFHAMFSSLSNSFFSKSCPLLLSLIGLTTIVSCAVPTEFLNSKTISPEENFLTQEPMLQPTTTSFPTEDVLAISDRLIEPILPENPTQEDLGHNLYYHHCMPCHGDVGQGLTDEWRAVWEEDHQNCWGRGCHGNSLDRGFPIPKFIPAVNTYNQGSKRFSTQNDLFDYLNSTHPPQRPGALNDDEYWALTTFLMSRNGFTKYESK